MKEIANYDIGNVDSPNQFAQSLLRVTKVPVRSLRRYDYYVGYGAGGMMISDELIAGFGGALLGSVFTGLSAWLVHRAQQVGAKREELRSAILTVLDLREKRADMWRTTTDPALKEAANLLINQKRTVYLQGIEALADEIPNHVSSMEYGILAFEATVDSNFPSAQEYYLKAIEASHSPIAMNAATRGLAVFYFTQSPLRNVDIGRRYFQRAIDMLDNRSDAYSSYTRGWTYEWWGMSEYNHGFRAEGQEKLDLARECYSELPDSYDLKQPSLTNLEARVRQYAQIDIPDPLQPPASSAAQTVRPDRDLMRTAYESEEPDNSEAK